MNWIEFPEQNRLLKAGANPMTKALPVSICTHPAFKRKTEGGVQDIPFFISKWELTEEEKAKQREKFLEVIREAEMVDMGRLADDLMKVLQPVFLCAMHTPPPVSLFSGGTSPFDYGYVRAEVRPPTLDPKDN